MFTDKYHVEPLMQTPEQMHDGTITYRVYTDGAWRNVEGLKAWLYLTQEELLQIVEEVYKKNKSQRLKQV
jgi:hypothetical protein